MAVREEADETVQQAEEAQRETTRLRAMLCRPSVAAQLAAGTPLYEQASFAYASEFTPFVDNRLSNTGSKSTISDRRTKVWRHGGGKPSTLYKTPQHFAE